MQRSTRTTLCSGNPVEVVVDHRQGVGVAGTRGQAQKAVRRDDADVTLCQETSSGLHLAGTRATTVPLEQVQEM